MSEEQARGSPSPALVKPRQFCPVLSFGQRGSSALMLNKPWGVAVNERDEIAVTDTGNHRVQVFSSDGTNTYDLLIEMVINRENSLVPEE